jgi:cell division septal protein FtsQ
MSYKGFTEEETKFLIKIGQINKPIAVVKKTAAKKKRGIMAIYLSNGAVVTLNSVDLSDLVTAVTINSNSRKLQLLRKQTHCTIESPQKRVYRGAKAESP